MSAVSRDGIFDIDLARYYQSDSDFATVVSFWPRFPQPEVVMGEEDLIRAQEHLPKVPRHKLATIKTKCNIPCSCGRLNNALDLIDFCLRHSIHGREFLTAVFTEERKDHKISIMDSYHRSSELPTSVVYIDDTRPIPCPKCGEAVHLYLLHDAIVHWWDGKAAKH